MSLRQRLAQLETELSEQTSRNLALTHDLETARLELQRAQAELEVRRHEVEVLVDVIERLKQTVRADTAEQIARGERAVRGVPRPE